MRPTKKIITVMLCLMLALGLAGCTDSEDNECDETVVLVGNSVMTIRNYVDEETGVNYLVYFEGRSGGICPRYNADGSLYVKGGEQE